MKQETAISKNGLRILKSRYFLRDPSGNILENTDQLFRRVASHIASAEKLFGTDALFWEEKFFRLMSELKFLPNSPTLMNAGTGSGQLSACFVLPIHDSIESIFTTLKNTALIHQSGGGTGFNFSELRPSGDFISTHSGNASGPISFMKVFDAATENIKQGGKRRGANMGILNADHPDIEEFISSKVEEGNLKNFNISVGASDKFMKAVIGDQDWELIHPSSGKLWKKIKARNLWSSIINGAHNGGDPGMIFLDNINKHNPTPALGSISCTNPCGEVPLLPFEACNLGSIDVAKFFDGSKNDIRWKELRDAIESAVRFLDNVVEVNDYLLPEIKELALGNRKTGLGVMGWADLLICLEIPYASDAAIELAEKLMKFFKEVSSNYSSALAESRGSFTNISKSMYASKKMRNATRTSIAPTGTISIIAETSSSIEPLFALAVRRENILENETLTEVNPHFVNYLKKHQLYSEELVRHVRESGSVTGTSLPEKTKKLFEIATEIEPVWHLKHQIAFQRYTDNAVSKTINLPFQATKKDVEKIYLRAWEEGAKGITVFRNESRKKQVLIAGTDGSCRICREG